MKIEKTVRDFIVKNCPIRRGEHILAAVSGGPDSVALAHVLNDIKNTMGFHLSIVHFNHHLRKSSDIDERSVKKLSDKLGLSCTVGHWRGVRGKFNGSMEDAARIKRYQFFKTVMKKTKADALAVAHTKDDLAETVLMRMIRGSGLKGLRAILPKRQIFAMTVIRPFLDLTKKDVLHYLNQKNFSYRIDETNERMDFSRNKIRRELLPFLKKKYNPGIVDVLSNLSINLAFDFDYLEKCNQKTYSRAVKISKKGACVSLKLNVLKKLHPSPRRMVIRLGIEKVFGEQMEVTTKHILEVEDLLHNRPVGSIVHLPHGICVILQKDALAVKGQI